VNFQHVELTTIKLRNTQGGVVGLVAYNERLQHEQARQAVRYIEREGGHRHKHDLVIKGHANLPSWARDTQDFFAQAAQYGHAQGVAWKLDVALPRELSREGQEQLADAIRDTYFSKHPQSWAIHNPTARDGQPQPHLHMVIFMQVDDGIARHPVQWFRKYEQRHPPEQSGAYRYETFSKERGKHNLVALRKGIERLTNHALELEGQEHRVWAGSVHSLGLERTAAQYLSPGVYKQRKEDDRVVLQNEMEKRDTNGKRAEWEQQVIQVEAYKTKEKHLYHGLTMEQAVLYERERFYAQDHTPWREAERAQHREQIAGLEWQRTKTYERLHPVRTPEERHWEREGPERARVRERTIPERAHAREHAQRAMDIDLHERLLVPLLGNTASRIYHVPGDPNYGDVVPQHQIQFWSHAEALDAGYRQARNQHYGRGAEEAMQARERRQERAGRHRDDRHRARTDDNHQQREAPLRGLAAALGLDDDAPRGGARMRWKKAREEKQGWSR